MVGVIHLEELKLSQRHTADNKQLMLLVSIMYWILPLCIEPCSVELLEVTLLVRRVPVAECGYDAK